MWWIWSLDSVILCHIVLVLSLIFAGMSGMRLHRQCSVWIKSFGQDGMTIQSACWCMWLVLSDKQKNWKLKARPHWPPQFQPYTSQGGVIFFKLGCTLRDLRLLDELVGMVQLDHNWTHSSQHGDTPSIYKATLVEYGRIIDKQWTWAAALAKLSGKILVEHLKFQTLQTHEFKADQ